MTAEHEQHKSMESKIKVSMKETDWRLREQYSKLKFLSMQNIPDQTAIKTHKQTTKNE